MHVTNHPNKASFDRKFKESHRNPATYVRSLRNPLSGEREVFGVWDRKGNLVEMHRWTDLT